jgi:hypothetical protein
MAEWIVRAGCDEVQLYKCANGVGKLITNWDEAAFYVTTTGKAKPKFTESTDHYGDKAINVFACEDTKNIEEIEFSEASDGSVKFVCDFLTQQQREEIKDFYVENNRLPVDWSFMDTEYWITNPEFEFDE